MVANHFRSLQSIAVLKSYSPESSTAKPIGQFAAETLLIALNDNALYRANGHTIDVCQFHGSIKQTIATTADEGEVVCLDAAGTYLTVVCKCMPLHFQNLGDSIGGFLIWSAPILRLRREIT